MQCRLKPTGESNHASSHRVIQHYRMMHPRAPDSNDATVSPSASRPTKGVLSRSSPPLCSVNVKQVQRQRRVKERRARSASCVGCGAEAASCCDAPSAKSSRQRRTMSTIRISSSHRSPSPPTPVKWRHRARVVRKKHSRSQQRNATILLR